jgi:molecular chaperone DnaK (HSP70)
MATDINIQSLFPALRNAQVGRPGKDVFNTTFIGIDFGTSTTVVSIATIDKETKEITTAPIWLNQKLYDGAIMKSEKIPTVLAWYNQQLLVGKGAADLKFQLKKGVNVWYSFKMELGVDLGSKYYNSELDRNSDFPILNPKDAAKIFFQYLKAQIDRYVNTNNLPQNIQYAVSIPASFEANQRKELIYALEQNGISINKQSLIDEPNAAFLSYVQVSSSENNPLIIPDGDNPKVLVFDFGAGTCDVSILELGKDFNGIYSKNLSISKFEQLGGDDIDRLIAIDYLFPQLLKERGRTKEDFRTPEKQRIISQLLKAAEQLKIMICENIALQTNNRILPTTAVSKDYVSVGYKIEIDSRKGLLSLTEPKLSYAEFNEVMKVFLKSTAKVPYKSKNVEAEFATIFSPIQTALNKASLSKNEIDYVLFIGGSSKNPYVQAALKEHFKESDLLVPRDLQTHVSAGAAMHSLVFNGFGKNIIQPITSEPFIVITKDETPKVILKAGTHIPCDLIVIDDLVTSQDGQKAIELPICLGNINKLLYNIQIVSSNQEGFKRNTPVKLELEITTDKLLLARATAVGQQIMVEPINPFANKELTTEQRIVLKAERQANLEAEQNGGKPTKQGLETLYKAYEKVGKDLRAAETLELLNELYPSVHYFNQIGVLYSSAGYDDKALEYYEKGYNTNKNATTAFNYAYKLKDKDKAKFKEILEESLQLDPNKPHSLYELGRLLKKENNPEGKKMVEKAFETWKLKFETNQMSESDYSWLSSAADDLGMKAFARQVRDSKPQFSGEKLYNSENLTITSREEGLIKK